MSYENQDIKGKQMVATEIGTTRDSCFECPICLNVLEEAIITTCGHRFCMKCINFWLEQKTSSCPIDLSPLSRKDIVPDNLTRREIVLSGKQSVVKENDIESYNLQSTEDKEKNSIKKDDLYHGKELEVGPCGVSDPLVTAMYERIIFLEQRAHEQDILIENLRRKVTMLEIKEGPLATLEEEVALRCCNGLFVWRVTGFSSQLAIMQEDQSERVPPQMLYSPRFYTRPSYGYRFCIRLNLSLRNPSHLSLVVHVVRGEFDSVLPWPFSGRITLSLLNQRDISKGDHLQESIKVGGEGCPRAFSRPPADGPRSVNPRGFGYMEFVALDDLEPGGFLVNDMIVIKVHVEH